jgi:hypothetical protein
VQVMIKLKEKVPCEAKGETSKGTFSGKYY